MSTYPPNGLISQGLTINGQSTPDPVVQAPTGVGLAAVTENLETVYAAAADTAASNNTVTVDGLPVLDPIAIADQIIL